MSLPLTPSPQNEISPPLRYSFLAYTSRHTARGDSVEAGAEKPTDIGGGASYLKSVPYGTDPTAPLCGLDQNSESISVDAMQGTRLPAGRHLLRNDRKATMPGAKQIDSAAAASPAPSSRGVMPASRPVTAGGGSIFQPSSRPSTPRTTITLDAVFPKDELFDALAAERPPMKETNICGNDLSKLSLGHGDTPAAGIASRSASRPHSRSAVRMLPEPLQESQQADPNRWNDAAGGRLAKPRQRNASSVPGGIFG